MCQNEEKLNSAHGPAMLKALHDSSSRDSVFLIDVDDWSSNEETIYPTRLDAKVESFAVSGKSVAHEPYLKLKEGSLTTKIT